MGLDIQAVKFLLHSAGAGVNYRRTATLARQTMMAHPAQLAGLSPTTSSSSALPAWSEVAATTGQFTEPFWKFLGAEEIVSFDASPFEQATVVHDMNQPLPPGYAARFDTVVDSGTLEHIFNLPVALRNAMELVALGGHLIIITPTNNFTGHGFYQFSPELFWRTLAPANGFRIKRMLVAECFPDAWWYEVPDPATVGRRVTVESRYWTHLFIIAERTELVEIFRETPQQSDYDAMWKTHADGTAPSSSSASLPAPQSRWARRRARWLKSLSYRWIKFSKFGGKEREFAWKTALLRRVTLD